MDTVRALLIKLVKEESGAEPIEVALVGGLVAIAIVSVMIGVGMKVYGEWSLVKKMKF
jgi:Flp pilus assembly pilin Flp